MKEEAEALVKAASVALQVPADVLRALGLPVATEFGMLMGDAMRARRLSRLPKLAAQVSAAWKAQGITPRELPDSFAAAWLDAATLEDAPDLQQRWTGLLVNAGDPDTDLHFGVAFAAVLRQLRPLEVALLDWLGAVDRPRRIRDGSHEELFRVSTADLADAYLTAEFRERFAGLAGDSMNLVIEHLEQQRLIVTNRIAFDTVGGPREEKWIYALGLSLFGRSFVEACTMPPLQGPTQL